MAWGTLSGCLLFAGVAGGCKPDTQWLHEHCWRRAHSLPACILWEAPINPWDRPLGGPPTPGGVAAAAPRALRDLQVVGKQAPEQDVRVESGSLVSSLGPCVCPHTPSPVTAHHMV